MGVSEGEEKGAEKSSKEKNRWKFPKFDKKKKPLTLIYTSLLNF